MEKQSRSTFSLIKLYFAIVSVVGVVGLVVGFGVGLYQLFLNMIISDQEYLIGGNGSREIKQCADPYYRPNQAPLKEGELPKAKTDEEIKACKDKLIPDILATRDYQLKQDLISGFVWWGLFMILFLTHFPYFLKISKEHDIA